MNTDDAPIDYLLHEDVSRYVMFPVKDEDIWKMYKKQVDCFWRAEEVDLSKDLGDWSKLNDDEKYLKSEGLNNLFHEPDQARLQYTESAKGPLPQQYLNYLYTPPANQKEYLPQQYGQPLCLLGAW